MYASLPPTSLRAAAAILAVVSLAGAAMLEPSAAAARCAHIETAREAAQSLYVFEGRLESVAGGTATFVVTAVWQGAPPERVSATVSGRRPLAIPSDVGTEYLVFAMGTDPSALRVHRCGSSAPLASAGHALEALRALGRTRTAR